MLHKCKHVLLHKHSILRLMKNHHTLQFKVYEKIYQAFT